jgi:hypothetical protein
MFHVILGGSSTSSSDIEDISYSSDDFSSEEESVIMLSYPRQHNVNMNTETRNSPRLDKARQKQSRHIPKYILDVLDKY